MDIFTLVPIQWLPVSCDQYQLHAHTVCQHLLLLMETFYTNGFEEVKRSGAAAASMPGPNVSIH